MSFVGWPWMTLKLTQLSLLCPVCGADVPPSGRRGTRRTYCSAACLKGTQTRVQDAWNGKADRDPHHAEGEAQVLFDALPIQLPPDLLDPVNAEVLLVHALDLDLQLLVAQPV